MKQTRLRITSDGTPRNTKITTEDGTLVKGIVYAQWKLDTSGYARLVIELSGVAADVVGLVEEEDISMLQDPMAVTELTQPQEPPQGPGFTDVADATWTPTTGGSPPEDAERDKMKYLAEQAAAPEDGPLDVIYVCPVCGTVYDDPDQVCVGDEFVGEHEPMKVEAR